VLANVGVGVESPASGGHVLRDVTQPPVVGVRVCA
jgi:hypothetical protein